MNRCSRFSSLNLQRPEKGIFYARHFVSPDLSGWTPCRLRIRAQRGLVSFFDSLNARILFRAATLETPLELISPELREQLLPNGEASRDNPHFDPHPVVKWFNPCGAATWLICELDPDDEDLAYGLCDLGMGTPEPGHLSIRELMSIRLMGGALGIERDLYWKANKPLSEYVRLARFAGRIVD